MASVARDVLGSGGRGAKRDSQQNRYPRRPPAIPGTPAARRHPARLSRRTGLQDDEAEREAAVRRMLDHYLSSAHEAARLLQPVRRAITVPAPRAGVMPESFGGYDAALAWFQAEHQVLRALVAMAAASGADAHVWRLAWCLVPFFYRRALWSDWIAVQETALGSATRLGDPRVQGEAQRSIGMALAFLGPLEASRDHFLRAIGLFRQAGDPSGEAQAHDNLASVLADMGRPRDGIAHSRQAIALGRSAGDRYMEGLALMNMAQCFVRQGDQRRAIRLISRSLGLARQSGNADLEAHTYYSLGVAYQRLADSDEARASYQRAVQLFAQLGDRYHSAKALYHLGDAHHEAGDGEAAAEAWRQAVAIMDDLDHPDAGMIRARLRAGHPPQQSNAPGAR